MPRLCCLALLFFGGTVCAKVQAHYHMLLPDRHSVKKDETVRFTYQFGHPFEHKLFDAAKPKFLFVLGPDGKKTDLHSKLEAFNLPTEDGKKVKGFQFSLTPDQRGDYVVVAEAEPVWMEEDNEFFADVVKVILHVQAQKGWDSTLLPNVELRPLTRPYGLLPGMVVQAQAAPPLPAVGPPDILLEVERYNAQAPQALPPEELITRTVRTDPNGVATTTLTESGWWCLTAARKAGFSQHEGKKYPVRQRSTLWLYVDDKPKQ